MAELNDLLVQFRKEIPELNQTPEARVKRYLDLAQSIHNTRKKALLYAAAHMITLAQEDVRREVSDPDYWQLTEYGRIFKQLEDRAPGIAFGARLVGGGI